MMEKAIRDFPRQFEFEPKIENIKKFISLHKFVLSGLGGSHLGADIIKTIKPELDIIIHRSYGLPQISKKELKERLFIACSYSGNTEEVIDGFFCSRALKIPLLIIARGGRLLQLAEDYSFPYIKIPDTGIQPRSAVGFLFRALLKATGEIKILKESEELRTLLEPMAYQKIGRALAQKIKGKIPIIYASEKNFSVAYNWKIKLNETGKIPAFYNLFPELTHNEINSFDVLTKNKNLGGNFCFIILKDPKEDHPRVIKRMAITRELYRKRGFPVEIIELKGKSKLEKIFSSLLVADWLAFYLAKNYQLDPEEVPVIEELKRLMK